MCKDFSLRQARRRIGVVERRDGSVELIVSRVDDPDTTVSIPLSDSEIDVLAGLLGVPAVTTAEDRSGAGGLTTRQLGIDRGSPFDGRPLADTEMRTRTGVSIVAVVRAGVAIPSPATDFVLVAGDRVVTVGTGAGLDAAARLLTRG
ncbi:potassium transporter TrkA [Nocardia stercoris]|uniref:Potassium transporter TrkA n=1 Tax=Nocardia stercoris TaxID=2483361 RepID=A0A3M2KUT1_9NOCA|nr:potassium transporter TrkA [Nocardia stercoris]